MEAEAEVIVKKKASLSKLTLIYMIGNFSSRILSFLLVFVMTYTLTREEIGKYDLIITTISLIVPFVSTQIDAAQLRWLLDAPDKAAKDKIFNTVFLYLAFNIVCYSVLFFVAYFIFRIEYALYIYVLSVFQVMLPTLQQGVRGLGKNKLYAYTGVIYSLLYVSATVFFLYVLKASVEGVLVGNIIATSLVVIFLIIKNKWYENFKLQRPDKALLKNLINYSLPLLPNSISWWLVGSSTRYVILLYLGVQANGIFAISFKYPTIIMMLSNVFNLAWQEKAIKLSSADNIKAEAGLILDKYIRLLLGAIIVLSSCSKFIMFHLVDKNFFEAWKYMPILLYAVFLQALAAFYGVGYLSSKKTRGAFVSSIAGGITTFGSSFLFVQFMGLYGISCSILLGYLVMLLIRMKQTKEILPVQFPLKLTLIFSLVFVVMTFNNYIDNVGISMTVTGISGLIFIYLNNKYLTGLIGKIKLHGK